MGLFRLVWDERGRARCSPRVVGREMKRGGWRLLKARSCPFRVCGLKCRRMRCTSCPPTTYNPVGEFARLGAVVTEESVFLLPTRSSSRPSLPLACLIHCSIRDKTVARVAGSCGRWNSCGRVPTCGNIIAPFLPHNSLSRMLLERDNGPGSLRYPTMEFWRHRCLDFRSPWWQVRPGDGA